MVEKLSLDDKARVVKELFDHGAASVEISGEDLKVTKTQYGEIVGETPRSVVVRVINQNTVQVQLNISIEKILHEVNQAYEPQQYREAKKQLKEIQKELEKEEPNKKILKKGLLWAAKFGERIFWQLLPLVVQHYNKLDVL